MSVTHMKNIGKNDEWETPQKVFEEGCLLAKMSPKLDVCADHESAKCSSYFGPDHTIPGFRDGLNKNWGQDFFMNPPYSHVSEWIRKAVKEVTNNKVKGLILTFAKTDTIWWHDFIEGNPNVEIHFIKGRIKFEQEGIPGKHYAPYPSVWIILK